MVARPLHIPEAHRTVRLVYRRLFPRLRALEALAEVIFDELPASVQVLRQITAEKGARRHRRTRTAR